MEDSHLTNFFSPWEDLSKTSETTAEYEARLKKILTQESRLKKIIDDEAKIDYARHKGEEKGLEKGRKEGLEEGLEKGLEKGRQEGKEEGLEEGRKEGKEEGKEEVVRNMLSEGLSLEQVAKYAKLTIEQVKVIQDRLES